MSELMFRGRVLNPNTMMYEFRDGSGTAIPFEVAQDLQDKLALNEQGATIDAITWEPKK